MAHADPLQTSLSLLDAARENDALAWQRLCDVYFPLTYTWARRAGLQESDAADVVQNVFGIVSSHLHRFRKERPEDSFRGWLWTITRNEIRVWFRKQSAKRDQAEGGTDANLRISAIPDWVANDSTLREMDPEDSAEAIVVRKAAEVIRNDFEPHTWQAFWRATVEGHSSTEIAADLNMTTGAVRQAKFRVLMRLREMLG